MFETDITLALQSLASGPLTWLMRAISFVGTVQFLVPCLIVVIFGFDLRKGFALMHLVLWTAVITSLAKAWIDYPRPDLVDARVLLLESGGPNLSPFVNMDAPGFWALLPQHVVAYQRAMGFSPGIPSAHASIAVAMWGGLTILFRTRWIRPAALVLIVLTPVSRIYLGKHFLADVLAGLLLGAAILALGFYLVRRVSVLKAGIRASSLSELNRTDKVLIIVYMLAVSPLLACVPEFTATQAGLLWGLNAGFLLLWHRSLRAASLSVLRRASRVIIASVAIGAGFMLSGILVTAGWSFAASVAAAACALVGVWCAAWPGRARGTT